MEKPLFRMKDAMSRSVASPWCWMYWKHASRSTSMNSASNWFSVYLSGCNRHGAAVGSSAAADLSGEGSA